MQTAAKKFQLVNSNTPFPQLASGWQQTRHAYGMDLSRTEFSHWDLSAVGLLLICFFFIGLLIENAPVSYPSVSH